MANSRRSFGAAAVCLLGVLLLAAPLSAQSVLGRVAGSVVDASGGMLPGATVTLTNVATNQVSTAISGETGAFVFPAGPAGHLQGRRRAAGLQDGHVHTRSSSTSSQEYSLTAKLEIGAVERDRRGRRPASRSCKTTTPEVSTTVQQTRGAGAADSRPRRDEPHQAAGRRARNHPRACNTAIDGGRPTWTQVTAGRHQRPGQLHPDELARLPAEPADIGQRLGVHASRRRCRARTRPAARPRFGW